MWILMVVSIVMNYVSHVKVIKIVVSDVLSIHLNHLQIRISAFSTVHWASIKIMRIANVKLALKIV